jgi:16S rRNA (uracil1498-N3)-methyltransferase
VKIHRFITNVNLDDDAVILTGDLFHQIKHVLKLKVNELVDLSDGRGRARRGTIVSISASSIDVHLQEVLESRESADRVVLYCAMLKRENFEFVVQKATEVGVSEIVPVHTERTVKLGIKMDRLQKIALEAAEQSGRSVVPTIHEPIKLADALSDAKRNDINVVFHMDGNAMPQAKKSIGLFIGPEGGWTADELALVASAGTTIASLGPLTLRAETAAIIATYLATHSAL